VRGRIAYRVDFRRTRSTCSWANLESKEIDVRKIIASLFISLDGVIEAPHEWHFPYFNDEMGADVGGGMATNDTMLLGRKTYNEFASYWPSQPSDVPPADYMNNTHKVVVSTTLKSADWQNSTVIGSNVAEELTKLKQQPGKNIGTVGSATLVRWLLQEGLLDELHLLVHPIVVGSGKKLFEDGMGKIPLKLVESKTFSTGVLALTYTRAE
jgi:dihydrofolate reductase